MLGSGCCLYQWRRCYCHCCSACLKFWLAFTLGFKGFKAGWRQLQLRRFMAKPTNEQMPLRGCSVAHAPHADAYATTSMEIGCEIVFLSNGNRWFTGDVARIVGSSTEHWMLSNNISILKWCKEVLWCWASDSVNINDSVNTRPAASFCDRNAQECDLVEDATAGGRQISTDSNTLMLSALVPVPKASLMAQIQARARRATDEVLPVLG